MTPKSQTPTRRNTLITLASVAAAVLMVPGVAWADGGCGSPFESWGCFKLVLALLTVPAVGVFLLSYPVTVLGLHLRRRRRRQPLRDMATGLLLLPTAYISTFLSSTLIMWLLEEGTLTGGAFVFAVFAGAALIQAAWAWGLFALTARHDKKKTRRRSMDADQGGPADPSSNPRA